MPHLYTTKGDPLLTLTELSKLSDVSQKRVRRWLENGELRHFITIYMDTRGRKYYKVGQPDAHDRLIDGTFYYELSAIQETPELLKKREDWLEHQQSHIEGDEVYEIDET